MPVFAVQDDNTKLNVTAANRFIAAALGGEEGTALKEENKRLAEKKAAEKKDSADKTGEKSAEQARFLQVHLTGSDCVDLLLIGMYWRRRRRRKPWSLRRSHQRRNKNRLNQSLFQARNQRKRSDE